MNDSVSQDRLWRYLLAKSSLMTTLATITGLWPPCGVTDPAGFLPVVLQVGIDDSSLEFQVKLDEEYARLVEITPRICLSTRVHQPTSQSSCPPRRDVKLSCGALSCWNCQQATRSALAPLWVFFDFCCSPLASCFLWRLVFASVIRLTV
jgi:hypothetical protein